MTNSNKQYIGLYLSRITDHNDYRIIVIVTTMTTINNDADYIRMCNYYTISMTNLTTGL